MQSQNQEFSEHRKPLLKKIQELEREVIGKHAEIAEANQSASMAIVKSNFKIESMAKEMEDLRRRQEEKEKTILTLKNEISLYNDECLELKKANEELDYSLQRVTKELKDIMFNYESEFEQMSKNHKKNGESVASLETVLKEKEKAMLRLSK